MKIFNSKYLKNQRGLTLIELLAVIVILGLIAAIAVPSIGGIINKTKDDAKVAEGIQIINAAKMYTSTHKVANNEPLTHTELEGYLDNVKDDQNDYVVTVKINEGTPANGGTPATEGTGKYTYELTDHDSGPLVGTKDDTSTEADLLAY